MWPPPNGDWEQKMRNYLVYKMARIVLVASIILLLPAVSKAAELYWDPGIGMSLRVPALYYFRDNGTGVRTTYPTGNLSYGTSVGFAWAANRNGVLSIRYVSGYTQVLQLLAYNRNRDTLTLQGYNRERRSTNWPWYGCRSGKMPSLLVATLCR